MQVKCPNCRRMIEVDKEHAFCPHCNSLAHPDAILMSGKLAAKSDEKGSLNKAKAAPEPQRRSRTGENEDYHYKKMVKKKNYTGWIVAAVLFVAVVCIFLYLR